MSVDLDDRIRQAAGDPQHGLDFQQVRARAGHLRRRRRGAGTVAAAAAVVIVVIAVPALTGGTSVPTVAPDPAGSPPEAAGSPEPQPDASETTTVDENVAAWRQASAGESLTLTADAWAQPSFEPLAPSHAAGWSPAAQDMLAPVIQPNPSGDGLSHVIASPHVGPDGRLLVVPPSDTDRVLVVGEDGVQHVVALPVAGRTTAVWAPAGYWFLLTRGDDTVAVHRIGDDGAIRSTEPVPYESDWGAILYAHEDEIWVSASFDSDPTRGPEATRLATDGGDTVVDVLAWIPGDQSPITTEGDLPRNGDGSYSVPVDGGEVTLALQHETGVGVDLTFLSVAAQSPMPYRERISDATVVRVHATVLLSSEGSVWATGFPDVATPSRVAVDPGGTPWFARITPDGYALTRLVPPTS